MIYFVAHFKNCLTIHYLSTSHQIQNHSKSLHLYQANQAPSLSLISHLNCFLPLNSLFHLQMDYSRCSLLVYSYFQKIPQYSYHFYYPACFLAQ